jgi:hypothetical protein
LSSRTINHDWYINSNEKVEISNQTITINGNIIINSTGILKLNNVTLILNNTDNNVSKIIVRSLGALIVNGSSIKPENKNRAISIVFLSDSIGRFSNALLDGLVQNKTEFKNGTFENASIVCWTNDLELSNSVIVNSKYAMYIENSSPHLENITIDNCANGIMAKHSQMKLMNCSISTLNTGFIIKNNSIISSMDSNLGDPDLDAGSLLFLNRSLVIQVGFITPYKLMIKNADVCVKTNNVAIYCTAGFNGSDPKTDVNGSIKPIIITQSLYKGDEVINYSTQVSAKFETRSILNRTIIFSGTGPIIEAIYFQNELPILSIPSVSPWSGNTETVFSYSIFYSDIDNDKPAKIHVEIDGSLVNMAVVNSSINNNTSEIWKAGVKFDYQTRLNAGNHKFKFIANEGFGFSNLTVPTGPINDLDGPTVEINNHDPILKYGSVTPSSGNANTIFKYRIKYRDIEGDKASIAKIYIDNIAHQMIPTDSESASIISGNGLWYEFETKLPVGIHEFFFKFKDINNSNVVYWPGKNVGGDISCASGPKVLQFENKVPVLGNGTVTPNMGYRYTLYSYTISYYDHEDDLPSNAVVFIDGEPHNLTRARIAQDIYYFETFMPMGQHYYHFEFRDDLNDHFVRFPEDVGTEIFGPVVVDLPPKLWQGAVTPSTGTPESNFIFSIYYEDIENDPPIESKVIIDNISYDLEIFTPSKTESELEGVMVEGDDKNNINDNSDRSSEFGSAPITKLLQCTTKLDIGTHSFYFQIKSQDFILRYPKTGSLTGPVVQADQSNDDDGVDDRDDDLKNQDNKDLDSKDDSKNENNDNESDLDEKSNNNSDDHKSQKNNEPEELSVSELDIKILNYSAKTVDGFPDYVYNFSVICQISHIQDYEIQCRLYIDDEPVLMSISKQENDKAQVIVFNVVLELSSGDHFYHFIVSTNQSNGRVPYKGEFIISVIRDIPTKEDNTGLLVFDDIIDKQRADIIKILIIVLLAIAILYFSFYRKYLELKNQNNEID